MAEPREAVSFLKAGRLSVLRACQLVRLYRSTIRSIAHPADDGPRLSKLNELAARYPRDGYRRITALVRCSEQVNQKRIRRL